jgi:phospholipase C
MRPATTAKPASRVLSEIKHVVILMQEKMAYFDRADIPFQWALADAFTICDGYHSSMLGPTWPNRLYLMSGTVDPAGEHGGPVYQNVVHALVTDASGQAAPTLAQTSLDT